MLGRKKEILVIPDGPLLRREGGQRCRTFEARLRGDLPATQQRNTVPKSSDDRPSENAGSYSRTPHCSGSLDPSRAGTDRPQEDGVAPRQSPERGRPTRLRGASFFQRCHTQAGQVSRTHPSQPVEASKLVSFCVIYYSRPTATVD